MLTLPAPSLAPALIGWELEAHGVRGRITETEAYQGEDDLACHASKGRTPRSETLYAEPGTLYVYLCYGMHALLNIVCGHKDVPAAVLIRSLEIIDGLDLAAARRRVKPRRHAEGHTEERGELGLASPRGKPLRDAARRLANGPAKLTQALDVHTSHNGLHLNTDRCPLRLLPPTRPPGMLRTGPRVGVAYAGPIWAAKPWRWWEDGFPVA